MYRVHGGGSVPVCVSIRGTEEQYWFSKFDVTISDIKMEIYKKYHVPPNQQYLSSNGRNLPDNTIYEATMGVLLLEIKHSNQTRLGLGIGGKIRQQIEKDEEDPRIWDVANSQLLNIQIINAFDFFALTGIAPPPTPINEYTYAEHGLPFYEHYRDTPALDIGDAFKNVQSVGQILGPPTGFPEMDERDDSSMSSSETDMNNGEHSQA